MIKLENFETLGWEAAIRGMRNPMNSWDKSDTSFKYLYEEGIELGKNDLTLMKKLSKAGTDHRKFMRMVTVYVDITAPLYWWKEFDTYKVGTVANSCSTMHKIADKEFIIDDFSIEHLIDAQGYFDGKTYVDTDGPTVRDLEPYGIITCCVIPMLNKCRDLYNSTKEKIYFHNMIQLLPSSYNQKRTVMLNYEVLANMYHARKNHKLDEWREFCEWIEKLPYFKELCIKED